VSRATAARLAVGQLSVMQRQLDVLASRRTADIPLTPIQGWFFAQELPARNHFNLAWIVCARGPLSPPALGAAVAHLVRRHAILSHRFEARGPTWRQVRVRDPGDCFESVDLTTLAPAQQTREIEALAARAQRGLDITRGPLIRVIHVRLGRGALDRIIVVVHHLAMDFHSWGVLLDELGGIHDALAAGAPVDLAPTTTDFSVWAARLARHARSAEVRAEAAHWSAVTSAPVGKLLDRSGQDPAGATATMQRLLPASAATALARNVPRAFGVSTSTLTMWALARAVGRMTGSPRVHFDLEGHGREDLFPDLRVHRTLGWFTCLYPVLLDVPHSGTIVEQLRSIDAQLGATPRGGIGYGLLRYLGEDRGLAERLAGAPAEICFNFIGGRPGAAKGEGRFSPAPESAGDRHATGTPRAYSVELSAAWAGADFALDARSGAGEGPARRTRALLDLMAEGLVEAAAAAVAAAPPVRTPSPAC
jgi:non-ribosomal peptide synthase protein (TIGR01720 family)